MVERVEEFLFDILGLAVPGLTLIFLLFSFPVFFVDIDKAISSFSFPYRTGLILLIQKLGYESKILEFFSVPVGIFLFFISYLIGTVIKVFSTYQYDFFQ